MKKTFFLLLFLASMMVGACQHNFNDANPQEFAESLTDKNVVVLDVRTAPEFQSGFIEGAINIDVRQENFLENVKQNISQTKKIAVYCRSGKRSAEAAKQMANAGFEVVNLDGGILAWEKQFPIIIDGFQVDSYTTKSGKKLQIYSLMHASLRFNFDGHEIEIDPVTKLGDRTVDYSSMPQADYIFVTHEHFDHFDKNAIATLRNPNTKLITNQRCAEMLDFGVAMKNGDKLELCDWLSVEAVPAYNTTPEHLQFHPKGRDNGYVLTIDGLRIYVAGDTEDIPEMADIKDVDIAFLPCNQPYTMTVEQFAKAASTVNPKILYPYHFGQTDISPLSEQSAGYVLVVRRLE